MPARLYPLLNHGLVILAAGPERNQLLSSLWRDPAVAEQHPFFTTGVLQSQAARAIRPAGNNLSQKFQELNIQGILTAEGHGGWSYLDGETACLGIGTADGITVGRARKRLVLFEHKGIVFRIGHSGRLLAGFLVTLSHCQTMYWIESEDAGSTSVVQAASDNSGRQMTRIPHCSPRKFSFEHTLFREIEPL